MTASPLVIILVLNWNSHAYTRQCVHALQKLEYSNYRILLIDNGSTDGSEEILKAAFAHLSVIQTGENLGYAGGNNLGIHRALAWKAEYIWLLNNDTEVAVDALTALVSALESDLKAGVAGSKIYSLEERDILSYAGGVIDAWRGRICHRGRGEVDDGQYNRCEPTAFVTGCSLLIRTSTIHHCGMMDAQFFLYYEDLDWNLRIQQAGYQCLYVPESKLWHQEGGSLGRSSGKSMKPDVVYYSVRNSLYFYESHFPIFQRLSATTWNLLSQVKAIVLLSLRRDVQYASYGRAVWQAWMDYFRRIRGPRRTRR